MIYDEMKQKRLLTDISMLDRKLDEMPRLKYAMSYHKNIRGESMQFHDKPYLIAIYKDNAREIVLQSSVQTGKSEFLIISCLEGAERGMQCLYCMPTIEMRNQFVANRIDQLFQKVPYYSQNLRRTRGSSDSRGLKHYGAGTIFFAGSNSATTFIEKPVDMVLGDEIDRFNMGNYALADDRMTASPYKLKREASNPTVDNFGINKRFRETDQRELMIKCEHCGTWQELDWFKSVIYQVSEHEYALKDSQWEEGCGRDINCFCIKCQKPVYRFTTKCAWVAKHPQVKDCHGYHIHQLLSSYVRVEEMWRKFKRGLDNDCDMQVFYNSILGLTFAGKGSKITRDVLESCKGNYLMPYKCEHPCVMGVDVGKQLNVVIRQILNDHSTLKLVFCGRLKDFEDLDYLFERFNIVGYVLDAMPETRKSLEWAKKKPGRGWAARYHHGLTEVKFNEVDRLVSADRTMLMDKVFKAFVTKQRLNPANSSTLDGGDYYQQLETPTRVMNEESNSYDWLGDPDHYFHAEVYCTLAYVGRGDFKVVGIPINSSGFTQTGSFDESMFPPGTPPALVEYYRNLYEQNNELVR